MEGILEGSFIALPRSTNKQIEQLKVGERVISYGPSDASFFKTGKEILEIKRGIYDGPAVEIENDDHSLTLSRNQVCLVNMTLLRSKFAVYMMQRGNSFRVGKCRMDYSASSGLSARVRDEKADKAWLLTLCDSEDQAYFEEQAISGRFGIPQLMFNPKKMMRGPSKEYLPKAWEFIGDITDRAILCLKFYQRDLQYPLIDLLKDKSYWSAKRPMIITASNLMDGMLMLPYTDMAHVKKTDWRQIKISPSFFSGRAYNLIFADSTMVVANNFTLPSN